MSLTDVMSGSGLHGWALAGLVIACAAFVAVLADLGRRTHHDTFERARRLPLDDGPRAPEPMAPRASAAVPAAPEQGADR